MLGPNLEPQVAWLPSCRKGSLGCTITAWGVPTTPKIRGKKTIWLWQLVAWQHWEEGTEEHFRGKPQSQPAPPLWSLFPSLPSQPPATSRTFTSACSAPMLRPDWGGGGGAFGQLPQLQEVICSQQPPMTSSVPPTYTLSQLNSQKTSQPPLPLDRAWGNTEQPHWHPSDHNMVPGMDRSVTGSWDRRYITEGGSLRTQHQQ